MDDDDDSSIIIRLVDTGSLPLIAQHDLDRARAYAEASKAVSTKRVYSSAWRVFTSWCDDRGHDPLPAHPTVVAAFVAAQAELKAVSIVEVYLAAIGEAHRLTRQAVPTESSEVRSVMKGVRRTHGVAQKGKAPLLVAHLRRISSDLQDNLTGIRDRALLLVGFAGALRRSELVGFDVADLDFRDEGLAVTVRRSKTDQQGAGRLVGLPYGSNPATCPVRSLRTWLDTSSTEDGPVFRAVTRHGRISPSRLSGRAVGGVVKRAVVAIGLDAAKYGGHSLRAGLATEAARAGAGEIAIIDQTGHRSVTSLRGYIRDGSLFVNNAAALVGL